MSPHRCTDHMRLETKDAKTPVTPKHSIKNRLKDNNSEQHEYRFLLYKQLQITLQVKIGIESSMLDPSSQPHKYLHFL